MELLILGPLEVHRNGTNIHIQGRTGPRVLAALALQAGSVVSLSALVDSVWDAVPPATAKRQVQNALARLRNQLGHPLIEPIGQGYRLNLAEVEVDAHQFGALVKQARQNRDSGDHVAALARLREALGLWRGPSLDGLTGDALRIGARGLNEARLAALEDRFELELELAQAVDVNELSALVERHPLNQRLTGFLMLALYRRGRTSDSLTVYEAIQQRLAGELGIDPDSALREMRTAIIREDPALAAPNTTSAIRAIPAQLPADIAGFTGRRHELARLDGVFEAGGRTATLATVGGTGGVGKTALAVHWAHCNRHRFPDGQLYVNLRGFDDAEPLSPLDALTRFLRAFDVPGSAIPSDPDSAAELYRSLASDKRMLVVIDNARDAEQVRPLLAGGGETLTLVTSRDRLSGLAALHGAVSITVDILDRRESIIVLSDQVGVRRLHAEPVAADRLAALCADLPLALRIAGANLANESDLAVEDYVRELEGPNRIEMLSIEGDPHAAVGATLDLSVQALPAPARRLFTRLGLIPGEDFHPDLAAAIMEVSPQETNKLLRTLVSSHLLEPYRSRRYRFHDLVREYAATIANAVMEDTIQESVADLVTHWYFDTRHETAAVEYPNVVTAFRSWRYQPRSLSLVPVFQVYLNNGLHLPEISSYLDEAHRLAQRLDDHLSLRRTTTALAAYSWVRGDYATAIAYGKQALRHALALDNDADGTARGTLGTLYCHNGDFHNARPLLEQGFKATERSGPAVQALNSGVALVNLLLDRGEYVQVAKLLRRLDACVLAANYTTAPVYLLLAHMELKLAFAERRKALELATDALRAAREKSHLRGELHTLHARARIRRKLGDLAGARDDTTLALNLASDNDYPLPEMVVRSEHALSLFDMGSPDAARTQLEHLDETALHYGAISEQARTAATLAEVFNRLGEYGTAIRQGTRACRMFAAMPYPLSQARVLVTLAESHDGIGEFGVARRHREDALTIFDRLGVPEADEVRRTLNAASAEQPRHCANLLGDSAV